MPKRETEGSLFFFARKQCILRTRTVPESAETAEKIAGKSAGMREKIAEKNT